MPWSANSITLPICFKFGVEKGRFVIMALILVPMIASLIISKSNLALPDIAVTEYLLDAAPFAGVVIIILSVFFSTRIYTHKEL